jgi:hypothetical protein
MLGHVDAETAVGPGGRGAGNTAEEALEGHRRKAAGQAHAVRHPGDGSDRAELLAVSWNQEHAIRVPHVDRERRGHAGKDDRVLDRDQGEVFHLVRSSWRYKL